MVMKSQNKPNFQKLNCETGLSPNIIDQKVFERELALCKKLNKDNSGNCGWGECANCGVIPLLYKLHKGELLEDPAEIAEIKNKLFK